MAGMIHVDGTYLSLGHRLTILINPNYVEVKDELTSIINNSLRITEILVHCILNVIIMLSMQYHAVPCTKP